MPRQRLYRLGALLVSALATAAVVVAVLTSGSTSQLAPGKPVTLSWDNGEGLTFQIGIDQSCAKSLSHRLVTRLRRAWMHCQARMIDSSEAFRPVCPPVSLSYLVISRRTQSNGW